MSETVAAVADDVVTGAHDAPATPSPDQQNDANTPQPEGEADTPETPEPPEEIEFDFGGSKLRVAKDAIPAEIADKLAEFTKGTWADYTRKSQAVAEQTRALEAQAAHVKQLTSMSEDLQDAFADAKATRKELERLASINLEALWQSDPDQARRLSDQRAAKEREFQARVQTVAEIEGRLTATQQQAAEQEQQHAARLIEAGKQRVAKAIPNFSPAVEAELIDYAVKSLKVSREAAAAYGATPDTAIMAWKAMQFDRMRAKAAPAAAQPTPAAPVQALKARPAAADRDPEKMSMDEFVRWRTRQSARA